jgi:hypothetical protein
MKIPMNKVVKSNNNRIKKKSILKALLNNFQLKIMTLKKIKIPKIVIFFDLEKLNIKINFSLFLFIQKLNINMFIIYFNQIYKLVIFFYFQELIFLFYQFLVFFLLFLIFSFSLKNKSK